MSLLFLIGGASVSCLVVLVQYDEETNGVALNVHF